MLFSLISNSKLLYTQLLLYAIHVWGGAWEQTRFSISFFVLLDSTGRPVSKLTAWVHACYTPTIINVATPYSRKLSREKTFANFTVLWLSAKVFSVKLGGVVSFGTASEQSAKVFSAKIVFFTNLWKFSPLKVSRYTVASLYDCTIHSYLRCCLLVAVKFST